MTNSRRILLPGCAHHLLRAARFGKKALLSATDFRYANDEIRAISKTYEIDVHAFCLLTDQVHILATPRREPRSLSTFMKALSARIALRNRKLYGGASPWSPRFASSPVEPGQWSMVSMAYIETLPVRLGLVRTPKHYRFSSFRLRVSHSNQLWTVDPPEYSRLGDSAAARMDAYKLYLRNGLSQREIQTVSDELRGNRIIGHQRFLDEIQRMYGVTLFTRRRRGS